MYRSRFVKPAACSLLLVTAIYAVSAACGDVTAPCAVDSSKNEARGLLDAGTWRAITVNGQPADGWSIPASFDYFYRGVIDFQTTTTFGDCDALNESMGSAVAQYALRNSSGQVTGNKKFVGRFFYDHKTHVLTLTAAGYEVKGTVSGTTMTLPAAHSLFGSATVVLQR
jgi:hypothetical protein